MLNQEKQKIIRRLMPDSEANENRIDPINAEKWLFAIFLSIIAYAAIIFVGALILPSGDNIASFLGVICIAVASKVLISEFPEVLSIRKPSFHTITFAVVVGFGTYAILCWRPLAEGIITEYYSYKTLGRIFYAILSSVIYPVAEEIYFRGLLFPILTLRFGVRTGAISSVLLFIISHMTTEGLLSLALLGGVTTWLVIRTKTIIPSIVTHITFNTVWLIHALMTTHK
jgi:membrane protease YdiL (CAAX protease family)